MKALSIRNPYATNIMCGEKKFEYRTWQTDYRGEFVVCSSKAPLIENMISGHALCIVNLVDIIEVTEKNYRDFDLDFPPDGMLYAWQIEVTALVKPVPVKGKLNFFEVDDSLIEVYSTPDQEKSDEEADADFEQYYAPYMYTGKR